MPETGEILTDASGEQYVADPSEAARYVTRDQLADAIRVAGIAREEFAAADLILALLPEAEPAALNSGESVLSRHLVITPGPRENITISDEAADALAEAGIVLVSREDLALAVNVLARGEWTTAGDQDTAASFARLNGALDAAGEAMTGA